jgi:uncharacterized protein YutE (UPF0331/DUF86 family)
LVRKDLVAVRLEKLRNYLKTLKAIRKFDLETFKIETTLLKELEGMAAFRNILVHDYFRLDSDQVYGILRDRIKTLEKLAKVYAALLE